jgi:hypothetical protein
MVDPLPSCGLIVQVACDELLASHLTRGLRNHTPGSVPVRDNAVLHSELARAFALPTTGSFDDLLRAIDAADQTSGDGPDCAPT